MWWMLPCRSTFRLNLNITISDYYASSTPSSNNPAVPFRLSLGPLLCRISTCRRETSPPK